MTANKLKASIDPSRWAVFAFSVLGAFLAALASQLGATANGTGGVASDPRTWLAIAGAYYKKHAGSYRTAATWLRRIEFGQALAATLITAIASITGNHIFGIGFDIAALTAVLTTVAGAVLAHVEALRFDFLVTTYLATARRLEDRKTGPREPLSSFISDCEDILATENLSWIAKWTKPGKV